MSPNPLSHCNQILPPTLLLMTGIYSHVLHRCSQMSGYALLTVPPCNIINHGPAIYACIQIPLSTQFASQINKLIIIPQFYPMV